MRRAAVALAVAAVLGGIASCLISRKSSDLACSDDLGCDSDQMCDRGYCVERAIDANPCPSVCTSCDFAARTCTIQCDTPNSCNNIACPAGYDCTINCTKANACDTVSCLSARSCVVSCTVIDACEDVNCGSGPCMVGCGAANACQDVRCADSCRCDVTCAAGNCQSFDCPMGTTLLCTLDGTTATTCNSTAQAGCGLCP